MNKKIEQMYLDADKLANIWFKSMSRSAPGRIRDKSDISDKIRDLYLDKGFDNQLFHENNRGALYTVVFKHLSFSKDALRRAALFNCDTKKSDSDHIDYLAFKNGDFDDDHCDDDVDGDIECDNAAEKNRKAEAAKYAVRADELRTDNICGASDEPSDALFKDYQAQLRLAQGEQIANMTGNAFGFTDRSGRTIISQSRNAICNKIFAQAAKAVGMSARDLNKLKQQYLKAA